MVFMEYKSMDDPEASVIFFETDKIISESVSLMNLAYAKYEKDIMASDQKVLMESGGYEDMITLYEAAEQELQTKSMSLIERICEAIRTFFEMIASKISSLFQKKDGKDIEQLVAEKKLQNVRLEEQFRDSKKLGAVVDDEMAKGDNLLTKLASGIGISDDVIDTWITNGKDLVKKVVPVTLTVGGAVGILGYLNSKMYKYKNDVKPKEEKAKKAAIKNIANIGTSDADIAKRNKDKTSFGGKVQKILGHIKWLGNEIGSDSIKLTRTVGSKLGIVEAPPKEKEGLQKVADNVVNSVKSKLPSKEKKPASNISNIARMNVNGEAAATKEKDNGDANKSNPAPSGIAGKANAVQSRGLVDNSPEPADTKKIKKKNK
jgi:hypothetical protein